MADHDNQCLCGVNILYSMLIVIGFLLYGCQTLGSKSDVIAQDLVAATHWKTRNIRTRNFLLRSYLAPLVVRRKHPPLYIYIEGDGFAWRHANQPSLDPTPRNPVALRLALGHSSERAEEGVTYLARPCQYNLVQDKKRCSNRFWTDARFSAKVIEAMDEAVDDLKKTAQATSLKLIGYSGGGAVAVLLAARRTDVERLITVASPLETETWARINQLTPMSASLNPADHIDAVRHLPQIHFVGGQDPVVRPAVVQAFAERFGKDGERLIHIESDFDHTCCWEQEWPRLLSLALQAKGP